MKRKSFYKHWWVHLLGFVMLLLAVFILNKKLSFFQFNKTSSANLEHKTVTEIEIQAAMMNNIAKEVKDLKTAEELFNRSLEHIPTNEKYKVLYNLGVAYANHEEHEKAIKEFSAAIKLNSNCYDCFVSRGNSYEEIYELKLAMDDYDKAQKINPKNCRVYLHKGHYYRSKLKNYIYAKENLTKCIELENNNVDAYLELIILDLDFNDGNNAQIILNKFKSNFNKNDVELYLHYLMVQSVLFAYFNNTENYFNTINIFIDTYNKLDNPRKYFNKLDFIKSAFYFGISNSIRNKNYSKAMILIMFAIKVGKNIDAFTYIEKLNKDKLLVEKLLKNEIPHFEYKKGMLAISK